MVGQKQVGHRKQRVAASVKPGCETTPTEDGTFQARLPSGAAEAAGLTFDKASTSMSRKSRAGS